MQLYQSWNRKNNLIHILNLFNQETYLHAAPSAMVEGTTNGGQSNIPYIGMLRHPELVSCSREILKQVQNDIYVFE